jgi:hypothetical protein
MSENGNKLSLLNIMEQSPHVVLLGAGASKACIPKGDKNGKKISTMDEIGKYIDLNWYKGTKTNLEEIYQELDNELLKIKFENQLFDYYSQFQIPDNPTVYDYLIISLSRKDLIASFNWDPLLIQAYQRCLDITNDLPEVVFLHGNTWEWYKVNADGSFTGVWQKELPIKPDGYIIATDGTRCKKSKLLYPVQDKDYGNDPFIKKSWEALRFTLKKCFLLTIFGFSAPQSDILALEAIKDAFLFFNKDNTINDISNFKQITFINPDTKIVKNFDCIINKTGVPFTETMNDYIQRIDAFYCQSQTFLDTWPRLSSHAYTHMEYKAEFPSQWPKVITGNTTWDELNEIVKYNTLDKSWFPISNKNRK